MEGKVHHTSEFGCGHHGHHNYSGAMHLHGGCCCAPGYTHRRFFTREEHITQLQEYLSQLQAEAKGVEEYISTLKQTDAER